MAHDLGGCPLDRTRFLIAARLTDGVAECLRKTCDDSGVVSGQVIQFDGLWDAVVLLGVLRGTDENLLVVVLEIVELEQLSALFDDATLQEVVSGR